MMTIGQRLASKYADITSEFDICQNPWVVAIMTQDSMDEVMDLLGGDLVDTGVTIPDQSLVICALGDNMEETVAHEICHALAVGLGLYREVAEEILVIDSEDCSKLASMTLVLTRQVMGRYYARMSLRGR